MTEIIVSSVVHLAPPTQRMADVTGTAQLVALWLHGKTAQSQKTYEKDVRYLVAFLLGQNSEQVRLDDLDLRTVTLNDLQAYADFMESKGLAAASRKRRLSSVKSLLAFGHEVEYLKYNAGLKLSTPKPKDTLAERILSELEVVTMIALTTNVRDRLLLRFLYTTAARVGEVELLRWKDIRPNRDGKGQVTLFGKGEKTRVIVIPEGLYQDLVKFGGNASGDEPVFTSRQGKQGLKARQIENIVAQSGERAGIQGKVSPHWLRHSHASHGLDRGSPPQLVQQTLGHASLETTSKYAHAKPNDSSSLYVMPV
ncbi:MAG: tyrosine-type recombinase/integrase [Brasilonema octagenarum HA4186-MV1]|jgi:integrase/recombinase XerD|nr:tyrosine-type recombinase/integrase [Brasilonema octagenarum HA4186-MV1]